MATESDDSQFNFNLLIYKGYVKQKDGRWILTPNGEAFLKSNPWHRPTTHGFLHEQNARLIADARQLRDILAMAKRQKTKAKPTGWMPSKPPATPKKRRRPAH
ncbi:MAG: hypothetical protein IPJ89_05305 [Candidatus Iainarchaeum archaeon]|uniref:Uncharacterized protein n=1 Tax=Candidatus Iainarchaeum sp. TaxID=3101447 RepID=A0A7T9DJM7_9ARCH|nr:MAG: hypothetical protein IPJ89_05305 [Candidatus Diapherotrites archaeon]